MLTVERREDGRKGIGIGLGFGGRMEENELEEGEACFGDEREASSPEKDLTNLSYIDEKLHDVLGHFQKDFEGGVSAENLGAMFGGYGSFLPTYQRSPSVWPHPARSPANASSHNGSKSPCSTALMGARQNPAVLSVAPNSKTFPVAVSTAPSSEKSCKKDSRTNAIFSLDSIPQLDSGGTLINGSDQKTLKVRIKVGPESASARNKAAIYSGLGLDISPSSSPEDSPYVSEDNSPDVRDAPDESPMTIIQIMTCFAVPGGYVVSPLHDSLLHLREKENSSLKNVRTDTPNTGTQVSCGAFIDLPPSNRDGKSHLQKKMKSLEKSGKAIDVRSSNCKGDTSSTLKRETGVEVLDGQDGRFDVLTSTHCSVPRDVEGKEGRQWLGESLKGSKIYDLPLDHNKLSGKGRLSSSESVKDSQLYSMESSGNTGVGTTANEPTFSKGNLGSKTNIPEEVQEERDMSNFNDASVDIWKEGRVKPEKFYDTVKSDPDENMERKDLGVRYAEPANGNSAHKVNLYEQDEEMMLQARDQPFEGKGKWKKIQTNGAPSSQSMKKNPKTSSSTKIKEKNNRWHSKGEYADDKLKGLKFQNQYGMNLCKESHVDLGVIKTEPAEDRTRLVPAKDKMMGIKHENEDPLASDEKAKECPVVNMVDNHPISEEVVTSMALNNPPSDAVVASVPNAPVVIEENWVGCDKCQKWRLLPYGTNPGLLPKKWQCNMLNWLRPGMNKCSISEEETTKALHALYQLPVSQCNTNANGVNAVAASNVVLAEGQYPNHASGNNMTNLPMTAKKKHKLKDPSNLVNGPALVQSSASLKKKQQASVKSRSLNDVNVNQYQLESNMLSKADLEDPNNHADFVLDKWKHKDEEKPRILGRHSDGGDFVGSAGRSSKLKSKRELDEDGFTTSKKLKKEKSHYASEGWHSDYEGGGNLHSSTDNALLTDVGRHNMQNHNGFSSSKEVKLDSEVILPTSSKRVKVQTQALSNGEVKDHVNGTNLERSKPGFLSKKRKNNVSQEPKGYPESIHCDQHFMDSRIDAREAFSENELKREKKLKVLKPEVKDSSTWKADGRLEKKGRPTKILFTGSRQHPTYGMENNGFALKEEHREQFHVNTTPKQAYEGMESFRKDSVYAQSSAAATSSSSKVSSSRKSRGNFQEARGSPVESVSSSPFRNSNSDKLLPSRRNFVRKDDALNAGFSGIGSPKNYSDGELDAGSEHPERMKDNASSFQGKSIEGHRAIQSRGLDSMRGKYDYKDNEANKIYEGKDKDGLHLTLFGDTPDDFSPSEFEGRNVSNATATLSHQHHKYEPLDKDHFRDSDKMNYHHLANGSMQRNSCKTSSHSREKHSSKSGLDKNKVKVPGSLSKQVELLSTRNGPDSQDMVRSASHDNYLKDFKHGNCAYPEKDVEDVVKKETLVKSSSVGGREIHSDHGKQGNLEVHGSGMFDKQHRDVNARDAISGDGCGKSMLQDITQLDPHADDKKQVGRSEMAPGRGKSQPVVSSRDKHETQGWGNQLIPAVVKGGRSEICPTDAANADPKVIKLRKPDDENGTHQVSLRQATPSRPDHRSPVRRDGQSSANVLKEARDLKHTANRLKSEGLELESTGLYFQAAMKFLYYASLLEPPHVESARHGEGTQSVQMYSETARLCEFCAHEYERCKKMAAAALAYKCVEVAYMKVSYFKHSSASKDRHELQTAPQMVVPGESPSSSASDVDNLNNQVTLDKSTSVRGVSSPQVAGNHVVAARYRPNFVRLLNYANETVCAFDASKKMQLAFAAAGSGLDKDSVGRLSSVKKVLDFNFHDVERLLQLIRFSMESISC